MMIDLVLLLELAGNALLNKRLVGVGGAAESWSLGQHVAGVKLEAIQSAFVNDFVWFRDCSTYVTRSPASPAKEDVAVEVHFVELLAEGSQASAVGRPTTGLGEDGLALVGPQPVTEGLENGDVVLSARGVGAAVVRVEVLVDIEDEVGERAVKILEKKMLLYVVW